MNRYEPKIDETQKIKIKKAFETMNFFTDKGCRPEENNDLAKEWLKKKKAIGCFIGGVNQIGDGLEVEICDRNQVKLCELNLTGRKQIDEVVLNSYQSLEKWDNFGAENIKRSNMFIRIADEIKKNERLFLQLLNTTVKPAQEVKFLSDMFYHSAQWILSSKTSLSKQLRYILNFCSHHSLLFLAWHVCGNLAFGNSILVVCSGELCLPSLLLAEICCSAGLPPGVFNVVTTDDSFPQKNFIHKNYTCDMNIDEFNFDAFKYAENFKTVTFLPTSFAIFTEADMHSASDCITESLSSTLMPCCSRDECLTEKCCEVFVQDSIKAKFVGKLEKHMSVMKNNATPSWMTFNTKSKRAGKTDSPTMDQKQKECQQNTKPAGGILTYCKCFFQDDSDEKDHKAVLRVIPFRTTKEAIAMYNHGRKNGCVSLWCENMSKSLEIVHSLRASTIWINCNNVIDASNCSHGFFSPSGNRVGGKNCFFREFACEVSESYHSIGDNANLSSVPVVDSDSLCKDVFKFDEVYCHYYGGRNMVPIGNEYIPIPDKIPECNMTSFAKGSQKDINSAVQCALSAKAKWKNIQSWKRSHLLMGIAEYLEKNKNKFISLLRNFKSTVDLCKDEVRLSIELLYSKASTVVIGRTVLEQGTVLEICEPLGLIGIVCSDDNPLLTFTSLVAEAIITGNVVVVVPRQPLAALLLTGAFKSAEVPAGVINIVTGEADLLSLYLVQHPELDCLWIPENKLSFLSQNNILKEIDTTLKRLSIYSPNNVKHPNSKNFEFSSVFQKTVWMSGGHIYP